VRAASGGFGPAILWVAACSAIGGPLLGTTVVGFRTNRSITIGADSRENDGQSVLPEPVCKIYQSGNSRRFWVSAQLWKEPLSGFSVPSTVKRAASKAASLGEWVAAFDLRIVPELRRTLQVLRSQDPQTFRATYAGEHMLEIVFFAFEHNVPVVFYRDYRTDAQGNLMEPAKVHCPGPKCNDAIEHFCLGACGAANKTYGKSTATRPPNFAQAIRREIGAAAKTDWTVGPPIDVLRIDRTGARWIGQEPDSRCPPIKRR
jgi:hypothetical protein